MYWLSSVVIVKVKQMHRSGLYCKEFIDKSQFVYNWIRHQPAVGEESITDWLLFSLSKALPSLKYITFSRHQEAKETGADWEWWFVDNQKALCLRVQAKKIFDKKDNYLSLAYQNKYGMQIEKLINDAKHKNFLPFYVFYYAPKNDPKVLCRGTTWSKSDCGTFISPATRLYNDFIQNGRKKVDSQDILIRSNPLHCLVCCLFPQAGNVELIYEHIKMYYPDTLDVNSDNFNQGLHESTPSYVQALLKFDDTEIPDWYEKEFSQQIRDINNLMVVDLRKNYNKTLDDE